MGTELAIPIHAKDELVGVILFVFAQPYCMIPEYVPIIEGLVRDYLEPYFVRILV